MLSSFRWLKDLAVRHFSKPVRDRVLLAHAQRQPVQRIVLLGLLDADRIGKLLQAATHPGQRIELTGIDLFELRGPGKGLSLREAHRLLATTGCKVRLVPGDPHAALSRVANSLTHTDLLLIAADQQAESLAQAWFYVPRMLHAGSTVFIEQPAKNEEGLAWNLLATNEIERLAAQARPRRAA